MVQLMAHFQQQHEQVMILQVSGQVKLAEAKSLQQQSSKQQITIKQLINSDKVENKEDKTKSELDNVFDRFESM